MGEARQRRTRHFGRHRDRRAAGQVDCRTREVFRCRLGPARRRGAGGEHRHAADPLSHPQGLRGALSRRRAGAAGRSSGAALGAGRQPCRLRGSPEEERRCRPEARRRPADRAARRGRPPHPGIHGALIFMAFDLADRGIYGFSTSETLRFADLDANGHVNNGAFIELLESARVSYLRQIVRSGLPRFRLVIGRIEADFKRQMFYPGSATACARLIEAHERKCVIGQGLFDGEGNCTAIQRVTMVSLNEETHRSTPFDPAVRDMLDRLASSHDGLPT
ncbi:MAG: hypothetical protein EBY18_00470 [Alphaproteobacteria bacterium]|nr:hypothetical protein [Alphaproteobacteria bacterium]